MMHTKKSVAKDMDQDDIIGDDGGPPMKKYGHHLGAAAHAGEVQYANARLQGNVGDHLANADEP